VAITLNEATRRLLDGKNLATAATLNPDGSPQSTVIWVTRDGDALLFSTTRQRRKGRNLARDPRISVLVVDADDPYNYVEIRGRAELTDDPDDALGNELTHKYMDQDAPPEPESVRRIIVRVVPEKVAGPAARA
jgi:PPOX class probable F420-dependent enzyme